MQTHTHTVATGRAAIAFLIALSLVVGAYISATYRTQALEIPTRIKVSICGNGIVDEEICDDGTANNDGAYASSTASRRCTANCQGFGPYCGDGILQVRFNEQCDDGNNESGDLCSFDCMEETPVQPRAIGSPPRGSVPEQPVPPGSIPSELLTKVVLRGKAYPNSVVNILQDGKIVGVVTADINADFLFTTTNVTPGTATFSFNAKDRFGTPSLTTTVIFDVVQSAVTSVGNIFLPPTIAANPIKIPIGGTVILSGQSVPRAQVTAEINPGSSVVAATQDSGDWSVKLDQNNLAEGSHAAKAFFQMTTSTRSGFGRSIAFQVGNDASTGCGAPDINGDSKVNLVDFSIFLLSWNSTDPKADFNCDSKVNLADFSIMLFAWTG